MPTKKETTYILTEREFNQGMMSGTVLIASVFISFGFADQMSEAVSYPSFCGTLIGFWASICAFVSIHHNEFEQPINSDGQLISTWRFWVLVLLTIGACLADGYEGLLIAICGTTLYAITRTIAFFLFRKRI